MVRVSAYPTVEWLGRLAGQYLQCDDVRREHGPVKRPLEIWKEKVLSQLSECRQPFVTATFRAWVRTPDGDRYIDCILEDGRRRIGIRLSGGLERRTRPEDALALVYGRFDVIYGLRALDPESDPGEAVKTLVAMHPRWFTDENRIPAGRSITSISASDRLARCGEIKVAGCVVTRIRLTRSSDWVIDFESALGVRHTPSFIPPSHPFASSHAGPTLFPRRD